MKGVKRLLKKIADKFEPKYVVYLILVFFICKAGYGRAFESFFWKDDWAMLWSANYNPDDFYRTTVGHNWLVRTGVFMRPYVLYFHKIIQDSGTWQIIGFIHKFINSLLFAWLMYSITKRKFMAFVGGVLYASYSGGIESYTWHTPTGLATSFILLAFTFYNFFLEKLNSKQSLILFLTFTILSTFSYVGRTAGLVMVALFWALLRLVRTDIGKQERKVILITMAAVAFAFFLFSIYVVSVEKLQQGYIWVVFNNINLFFGNIGNLLKNPFVKIDELGYLATINKSSIIVGYGAAILGILLGIIYLIVRSKRLMYFVVFIGWVYLFYFTNWVYGGGGVTTIVGSGHRYMAAAAVGVVALWVLILDKIKTKSAVLFLVLFLVLTNVNFSKHIIHLETIVRGRFIVEPIYNTLFDKMKEDDSVQVVVVDTPNYLKSFVISGWYPYTYAYMKGLKETTQFPVVISHWETAILWLCANKEARGPIQSREGFADYQGLDTFEVEHLYGFRLNEDGTLTERTSVIRDGYIHCQTEKE